jgi:hypothetical protein
VQVVKMLETAQKQQRTGSHSKTPNVELTGAARLYRAAPVLMDGLGVVLTWR